MGQFCFVFANWQPFLAVACCMAYQQALCCEASKVRSMSPTGVYRRGFCLPACHSLVFTHLTFKQAVNGVTFDRAILYVVPSVLYVAFAQLPAVEQSDCRRKHRDEIRRNSHSGALSLRCWCADASPSPVVSAGRCAVCRPALENHYQIRAAPWPSCWPLLLAAPLLAHYRQSNCRIQSAAVAAAAPACCYFLPD